MENEIVKVEAAKPADTNINVSKAQLAELIKQNKQAKDDNAKLLAMLHSSVEVIAFMKHNILGGSMPTKMDLPQIIKLATKIPKILNNLDDATMDALRKNFGTITDCAQEFLNEDQIKKIAN